MRASQALLRLLTDDYAVPVALARAVAAEFKPRACVEGQFLLRAGECDREVYFVESGLLRAFYLGRNGRELNKAFVREDMFFVALSAYLSDQPARFHVQALEPTRLVHMSYAAFAAWVEREPALGRVWRRYMEAHFVRHEAREAVLQLEDAAGRYRWFREQHPALVERVPLYQIASYLGVTNVTLSRVRARLARG